MALRVVYAFKGPKKNLCPGSSREGEHTTFSIRVFSRFDPTPQPYFGSYSRFLLVRGPSRCPTCPPARAHNAKNDPLEHSQGRVGVRRPEAVTGQRRRCHCLSRRHPGEHRTLSENTPVSINHPGLRLRDRALPVTERHRTPSGKHSGL